MTIKILQLNILKGKYLPLIVAYIQKQRFDVVTMQEVTGGTFTLGEKDIFTTLKSSLSMHGEMVQDIHNPGTDNYYGSAILFSDTFKLTRKDIVRVAPVADINITKQAEWKEIKRSAISLALKKGEKEFNIVTTHGAWSNSPYDSPDKIDQAKRISDYLLTLTNPFIFTGDLNVVSETEVVRLYERAGSNLSKRYGVTNTLNPRTHYVKKLFPPGLAVDFIFASSQVNVMQFSVIETPDLSDHFGLSATVEL